ncbi:MAG: hypothetical protein K0U36_02825, partial [Alphaproteobacteria bacterium]|nr:hypothetical protein [Alphaproteobacteria bacterium]
MNELHPARYALLCQLFPNAIITNDDAEYIHTNETIAQQDIDGIIMNPPFSASPHHHDGLNRRSTTYQHVCSAQQCAEPDARLVAITSASASLKGAAYTVSVEGGMYHKHGTRFETRLTLIAPSVRGTIYEATTYNDKLSRLVGELNHKIKEQSQPDAKTDALLEQGSEEAEAPEESATTKREVCDRSLPIKAELRLGNKHANDQQIAEHRVAKLLSDKIHEAVSMNEAITNNNLCSFMTEHWKPKSLQNDWKWEKAYELCDVAQVLFAREHIAPIIGQHQDAFDLAEKVASVMPSQINDNHQQSKLQYRLIPLHYALCTAYALNVAKDKRYLVPHAELGTLAVFIDIMGGELFLNDHSGERRSWLKRLFPEAIITEERRVSVLAKNSYDGIIMTT